MTLELTPKQEAFCAEYMKDLNGKQAAIRAGYSAHTAKEIASELMAKEHVQERIQELMSQRAARTRIDADYVLTTIHETIERCRQAEPVRDKEGNETGQFQFEHGAVLKGAELLGKHLKLFTEKHEHSGGLEIKQMGRIQTETVDASGVVIKKTTLQFNVGSPITGTEEDNEHDA